MNIGQRLNRKGDKILFYYDLGRGRGQRPSTGVFIYAHPKTPQERKHNKEALALLDVKKSEAIIESQAIGSRFIPQHKFKENFLDYYEEYLKKHRKQNNRHLPVSFTHFKKFVGKDFISPVSITENLCKDFRKYLLDRLTGETPANYFARFKWVIAAATKDGYFKVNPAEEVAAQAKPSIALKQNLEIDDYLDLLKTRCSNQEVQLAFIFCCYTGLRWVDVESLTWEQVVGATLVTRIIQKKTGQPVHLTMHPIAKAILTRKEHNLGALLPEQKVFILPSQDGANKVLKGWMQQAVGKYITWSCARLSFSILLKDSNVDDATIAYLLGHTTTKQVQVTYRRHRPKDQQETISKLPAPNKIPFYLDAEYISLV